VCSVYTKPLSRVQKLHTAAAAAVTTRSYTATHKTLKVLWAHVTRTGMPTRVLIPQGPAGGRWTTRPHDTHVYIVVTCRWGSQSQNRFPGATPVRGAAGEGRIQFKRTGVNQSKVSPSDRCSACSVASIAASYITHKLFVFVELFPLGRVRVRRVHDQPVCHQRCTGQPEARDASPPSQTP
jgi:hypothetical protein